MTEKPQWTLSAPDGRQWEGKSKTEVFEMAKHSAEHQAKQAQARTDVVNALRALLDGMKIPQAVAQGDHTAAVAFKDAIESARKVLNRSNATLQALQEAAATLRRYA